MSAYNRGELSVEAYLVRLLAAACRKNGGELRLKGEDIDRIGEATALMKAWDSATQEVVLTVSMGTFGEVFRVVPEKQTQGTFVFPKPPQEPAGESPNGDPKRSTSTLRPDEELVAMEKTLLKRRVKSMLEDELRRRPRGGQ